MQQSRRDLQPEQRQVLPLARPPALPCADMRLLSDHNTVESVSQGEPSAWSPVHTGGSHFACIRPSSEGSYELIPRTCTADHDASQVSSVAKRQNLVQYVVVELSIRWTLVLPISEKKCSPALTTREISPRVPGACRISRFRDIPSRDGRHSARLVQDGACPNSAWKS